jgi:hypothetical protein
MLDVLEQADDDRAPPLEEMRRRSAEWSAVWRSAKSSWPSCIYRAGGDEIVVHAELPLSIDDMADALSEMSGERRQASMKWRAEFRPVGECIMLGLSVIALICEIGEQVADFNTNCYMPAAYN